jgi:hypothetical protein
VGADRTLYSRQATVLASTLADVCTSGTPVSPVLTPAPQAVAHRLCANMHQHGESSLGFSASLLDGIYAVARSCFGAAGLSRKLAPRLAS